MILHGCTIRNGHADVHLPAIGVRGEITGAHPESVVFKRAVKVLEQELKLHSVGEDKIKIILKQIWEDKVMAIVSVGYLAPTFICARIVLCFLALACQILFIFAGLTSCVVFTFMFIEYEIKLPYEKDDHLDMVH